MWSERSIGGVEALLDTGRDTAVGAHCLRSGYPYAAAARMIACSPATQASIAHLTRAA